MGWRGGRKARAWQKMAVLFPRWGITSRPPEPKIEDNSFKCCLHVLLLPVLHSSKVYANHPKYAQFKHMSLGETFCTPRITEVMGTLTPLLFPLKTGNTGAQVEVM